jgi:hypothetical protein
MNLIQFFKIKLLIFSFHKLHKFFLHVFFKEEFKIKLVQNFCPIENLHHFNHFNLQFDN